MENPSVGGISHLLPLQGRMRLLQRPSRRGAVRNAVWTYEVPFAAVVVIKDYLAFYPDRVEVIEERPASLKAAGYSPSIATTGAPSALTPSNGDGFDSA